MIGLGAEAAHEALFIHGMEFPSPEEVREEARRMMRLKVEVDSNGTEYNVFNLDSGATCTVLEGFLSSRFAEGLYKCMQFRIGELVENKSCSPEWRYGLVEKIVKGSDGSYLLRIRTAGDRIHVAASGNLFRTVVPADLPEDILQIAKDRLRQEAERDIKAAEATI